MANKKTPPVGVNPTLPKVTLEIAGKRYFLVYDFNALAQAESVTGLNLLRCLDFQNLDATKIRGLLFAALLRAQPDTTIEEAGNLLGSTDAGKVMNAIVEAYLGSQASKDKEEDSKNVSAGGVS